MVSRIGSIARFRGPPSHVKSVNSPFKWFAQVEIMTLLPLAELLYPVGNFHGCFIIWVVILCCARVERNSFFFNLENKADNIHLVQMFRSFALTFDILEQTEHRN